MAHFARVINGEVVQVIVADEDKITSGELGNPETWYRTSYNTLNGTHPENRPFRYNFAGIGYTYNEELDAFIPPKPYPSYTFDEGNMSWAAPVTYPTDGNLYLWDEDTTSWVEQAPMGVPEEAE